MGRTDRVGCEALTETSSTTHSHFEAQLKVVEEAVVLVLRLALLELTVKAKGKLTLFIGAPHRFNAIHQVVLVVELTEEWLLLVLMEVEME